ncbi:VWA3B protein, partial [Pachycephala philippinensis]|nr:VWA3B protein [Pachycephala philippinensis]
WLQQGSRGLFGNVFEDDIYILIDTSQSMKNKLPLVKEKIFQLIQEQLRHKKRFNFVKFSAQAVAWHEKLAEVNEENLQDAWLWIKGLEVGSSTNTLKALQIALADTDTQAIYLLTDGRPDQPHQIILAEVQLHCKIPIHTVSFNCDDIEANKFLYELSTKTEGRFHYYNIYLSDPDTTEFMVNKDINLLKREIDQGEKDLEKVKTFHEKSVMMTSHNEENYPENKYTSLLRVLNHGVKPREEGPEGGVSPEEKSFSVKKGVKCTALFKGKLTEIPSGAGDNVSPVTFVSNGASFAAKLCRSAVQRTETQQRCRVGHEVGYCDSALTAVARLLPVPKLASNSELYDTSSSHFKPFKCISTLCYISQSLFSSSLDTPSALWLKTHGLAARRLTIMDALAPTSVPRSTKYIPVLDKHVVSKVFDKMLPLARVSNDKKGISLINPQAVNLDAYKEKLEQAIKSYERQELHSLKNCFAFFNRRLNLVIWRALSQEERDKFKENGPVQYIQHKEALLEALENLGWPVSCEDIKLLEDEILTALTYVQQASDLQESVKKETEKSSESHISNNKKTIQKCQIFVTHKSQKVIARSDVTGFYYPGTVIKNIGSTCALVDFSNGESCDVPVKFTIPVGGAMPCPHLQVGDYVFARTGTQAGNEYYVPAIVIATPESVETGDKLYTVLMFNNREEHCVRSELIKISQTKYAYSCQYIR